MKRFLLTLAALAATISVANAHTELSMSMPADGAALPAAPKEVMLHFSEAVHLTMLSLEQKGHEKQDLGPLPTKNDTMFTVALPALADGSYVVAWRALSDDSHVVAGEISFGVGAAGAGTRPAGAAEHADHGAPAQHDERGEHR